MNGLPPIWGVPLPLPVSPLIYPLFDHLYRGDNAVTEIFPEIFPKNGLYPLK